MTLGMVILKGPRRGVFHMSEVPLYQEGEKILQGYLAHMKHPPLRTL